MKKATLFLLIFFAACNSTGVKQYHHAKPDTSVTVVLYLTQGLQAKVDAVYRIVKDTFQFDTVNAETAKRVWQKDTLYFMPVPMPVLDSAGKIVLDSAGKPKQQIQFQLLQNNNMILQDYNKHL